MLKSFILDTSVTNFISLEILYPESNEVISSSSYNQILFNDGDGIYGVVGMNNHGKLDSLAAGTLVKIVLKFTLVNSEQIFCLTLLNQIPGNDGQTERSNQNGQFQESL